jgi:hypothetical protein
MGFLLILVNVLQQLFILNSYFCMSSQWYNIISLSVLFILDLEVASKFFIVNNFSMNIFAYKFYLFCFFKYISRKEITGSKGNIF